MNKIHFLLIVFLFLFFCCPAARAGAAKLTKQANRLYQEEKYGEAMERYKKAANFKTNSDVINFDMGAALYKKEEYKNAVGKSIKVLLTENKPLEAKANYNIGNSKYRLGSLEASLDYYKRAIELDTGDEDAKFNYEFVKKKLEEKKKEPPQQKPQPEKEKEEQQQKPQGKKPEKKKSDQDEKENEKEKKEEQRKKEEEQKKIQRPEERKEGMSEEETRMMLEEQRREEESTGDSRKKKIGRRQQPLEVLKDW